MNITVNFSDDHNDWSKYRVGDVIRYTDGKLWVRTRKNYPETEWKRLYWWQRLFLKRK